MSTVKNKKFTSAIQVLFQDSILFTLRICTSLPTKICSMLHLLSHFSNILFIWRQCCHWIILLWQTYHEIKDILLTGLLKVILCLGAPFLPPNCACWIKNKHEGYRTPIPAKNLCIDWSTASQSENFDHSQTPDQMPCSVKKVQNFYRIRKLGKRLVKICQIYLIF